MKDAIANTQATCEQMLQDAENKRNAMLSDASLAVAETRQNCSAMIAAEEARVEDARREAAARISALESQLQACLEMLAQIKTNNAPAQAAPTQAAPAPVAQETKPDEAKVVADEIAHNLAAMIGETEEPDPKPEPKHPTETATTKFTGLKFGPNYDPTK
jgi:hypothetical protein